MKTRMLLMVVLLLSAGIASVAVAQNPAVAHDTWTSGAPMPYAARAGAAVVVGNQIVLLCGFADLNGIEVEVANTLVYNPASNTWSKGPMLPMPIGYCAAATVNNVLYVLGGFINQGSEITNAVWAYDLQTKTWSSKSPMHNTRAAFGAVVEDNLIYVIGGYNPNRLNSVESYNPATDTWTDEAPLLVGKSDLTAGRIGTWIVAADGFSDNAQTGDNEVYNPSTNIWKSAAPDSTPRDAACGGVIGSQLYVAGGYSSWYALPLTESFSTSNTWQTLADIPQPTMFPFSAVYNGQLYCFGGQTSGDSADINTVQIYQP